MTTSVTWSEIEAMLEQCKPKDDDLREVVIAKGDWHLFQYRLREMGVRLDNAAQRFFGVPVRESLGCTPGYAVFLPQKVFPDGTGTVRIWDYRAGENGG